MEAIARDKNQSADNSRIKYNVKLCRSLKEYIVVLQIARSE